MVLCHQIDPFAGCDDSSDENSINESSLINQQSSNDPCDCSKIMGRDHLKSKRARKFRCNSKRIKLLSQPKHLTNKHCVQEPEVKKPFVEILRPNDEQTPVRIKMLAYPKVRKLVSSREAYKQVVDKEWFGRFDTLIKRSMMTMYSRLSNVQLPDKCRHAKWTKEDWKRHCEWLKKNALPKTAKGPTMVERKKIPLNKLIPSMQKLAVPRHPRSKFRDHCGYVSTVKDATQFYQPSDRIISLAVPKQRGEEEELPEFKPFIVSPAALMYKPSQHIQKLAMPKPNLKPTKVEDEFTEFGVMKRALTAAPQPHLEELAKPKDRGDDDGTVEKPLVSKKALKAKPTERILELAKPRIPFTKA